MGIKFDFQANNGSNQALDLNSKKELTFGNGQAVQAVFQVSLKLFSSECELVPDSISLGMSRVAFRLIFQRR